MHCVNEMGLSNFVQRLNPNGEVGGEGAMMGKSLLKPVNSKFSRGSNVRF